MKRILIVLLILTTGVIFAQDPNNDVNKLKDAIVNQVLYTQAVEQENTNLKATIKKVAEDLKNINTIKKLDSLKIVYGINKKK